MLKVTAVKTLYIANIITYVHMYILQGRLTASIIEWAKLK